MSARAFKRRSADIARHEFQREISQRHSPGSGIRLVESLVKSMEVRRLQNQQRRNIDKQSSPRKASSDATVTTSSRFALELRVTHFVKGCLVVDHFIPLLCAVCAFLGVVEDIHVRTLVRSSWCWQSTVVVS